MTRAPASGQALCAETLLAQGTKLGVPLVMPRLGEPVEPAHVERVSPWWREADRRTPQQVVVKSREPVQEPNESPSPRRLPWPFD